MRGTLNLLQGVARAGKRSQLVGQLLRIEPTVAPRYLPVVDRLILYAVVMEGRQQPGLDAGEQVTAVDKVVIAERKDVGLVCAVRRGRQAQQE